MRKAVIVGVGSYVPERVVSNADLAAEFGIDTTPAWIERRTGIRERRFAAPGEATSDLATEACRRALDDAGIDPFEVDRIVCCTLSPDRAFPGIGPAVQRKLGLADGERARFPACVDVRAQCSGFLYGLSDAWGAIGTGQAETVLVVGAEVHSAALDLSTRGRTVASLFGDGAGAVVLRAEEGGTRGVRRVLLGADGRHEEALRQDVWDFTQRPFVPVDDEGHARIPPEQLYAHMNGPLVFKHAVERMVEVTQALLAAEALDVDEVDLFLFHQANLRINLQVQDALGIAEARTLHNIVRYGNTTAATLPLLLDEAVRTGRLVAGMRVVLVAFGSGFTWGAARIDW